MLIWANKQVSMYQQTVNTVFNISVSHNDWYIQPHFLASDMNVNYSQLHIIIYCEHNIFEGIYVHTYIILNRIHTRAAICSTSRANNVMYMQLRHYFLICLSNMFSLKVYRKAIHCNIVFVFVSNAITWDIVCLSESE